MANPTKSLLLNIDVVCAKIADGESMTSIAQWFGCSFGTLSNWLEADTDRSARAREARILQARYEDEKALRDIESAADPFELARAKEMAHHRRWRAAKIAPKAYGDKMAVGGADDLPPIKTMDETQLLARIAALQAKLNADKG